MFARWQPFFDRQAEMNRLHQEMNRLFGRFDPAWNVRPGSIESFPAFNLWEEDDSLCAEAELPGMDVSDLEIYVNGGNQLSIRGERKQTQCEGGTWHRQERGHGKFARLLDLPVEVDPEKVEASFQQGVLTLKMPKREEAKPRRIQVKPV